jgi:hypothetical protein
METVKMVVVGVGTVGVVQDKTVDKGVRINGVGDGGRSLGRKDDWLRVTDVTNSDAIEIDVALFGESMMDGKVESVTAATFEERGREDIVFVEEAFDGTSRDDSSGDFRCVVAWDFKITRLSGGRNAEVADALRAIAVTIGRDKKDATRAAGGKFLVVPK